MVLLDNAPDLTQNVISLSLAELIKTKAPKEATPDENTDAAEKVKADGTNIKTISCEIFIDKLTMLMIIILCIIPQILHKHTALI